MRGLEGKNVLITGASSGIGRAIALQFAKEGSNVSVNYYSSLEEAEETKQAMLETCKEAESCGAKVPVLIQADVSKPEDVTRLFDETILALGGLDILINNAGIQMEGPSHEIEISKVDKMLDVNLRGAYLCARRALQHFVENKVKGVIINNSSVHEIIPRPGYLAYTMSKGGMENMTRTLALEYARQGIRVNSIGPGATITPINDDWINDPEEREKIEEFIPMGRAGTPEEMAIAAAFLASDDASYITGQTLFIDGGLTLFPGFREPIT
ncbi:MAG: glucose 1-dehydrogenase [Cyanobacteria bacterium P01_A01_bin.135]